MAGFVPLHVKSHFSLGLGTASIPALVQHAGRFGLGALGLTDLENLYGQVQFHAACRAHGIRPVTGVELRAGFRVGQSMGARQGRVVLLARDVRGYSRLCQIVTARRRGAAPDVASTPSLGGVTDELFVLTDDAALLAELARLVEPACLRALVVRPEPMANERELIACARRLGVPLLADLDVVMLDARACELQRLLLAVHLGRRVDDLPAGSVESSARTLRMPDHVQSLFADLPEALLETQRVAAACEVDLLDPRAWTGRAEPQLEPDFERRCHDLLAGLPAARGAKSDAYARRLAEELRSVRELGWVDLFSCVAALVSRARERNIPVAARGSAVSSLIGHVLGFSAIDPLAHGLYFERFVHAARRTPPDIDLDVASRRRDELIDWLVDWRGPERAARVSALHKFQCRAAHREGLRALGAPRDLITELLRRFPPDELVDTGHGALPVAQLPEPYRGKLGLIAGMLGQPRHLSLHPGGVALAARALTAQVALERTAHGIMTQYDAESLSRLGLAKVDLLGNHCLDELDGAFESWRRAPASDTPPVSTPSDLPLDDAATFELIDTAQTLGCFQLESPALRAVLARLPIHDLDDVTHALAIVRPGPASGRAKELFLARARGEAGEPPLLPAFRERLRATHGLLLYEEDILFVLSTLSGITLAEAEALRVSLGERSDDVLWLNRARVRLVRRAEARGFPPAITEGWWSEVVRFAQYSFNKAHATSQALLSYQVAYVKRHAPLEHGAAVLEHHGGLYPRRVLAADLSRRGLLLLPPCVSRSSLECSVEAGMAGARGIRIGLGLVKSLRAATRQRLLRSRAAAGPFSDIEDLLRRVRPQPRDLRALTLTGACDALLGLTPDDYPWVHEALLSCLEGGRAQAAGSVIRAARQRVPRGAVERVEQYRALSRIQNELRYLEMHVSGHPLAILRSEAERQGCVPSHRLNEHAGQEVSFAGIVAATRSVPLAESSGILQFITLEDEHGLVEARLAPDSYHRLHPRLTTPGPYLLRARVGQQRGAMFLTVQDLVPFHQRASPFQD